MKALMQMLVIGLCFVGLATTQGAHAESIESFVRAVRVEQTYSFINIHFTQQLLGTVYTATGFVDNTDSVRHLTLTAHRFSEQAVLDAPLVSRVFACHFVSNSAEEVVVAIGYFREAGDYAVFSVETIHCGREM
jgi:hypothetical protein